MPGATKIRGSRDAEAALERKGYVRRVAHPDDGRAIILSPTASGRKLHRRITENLIDEEKRLMAPQITWQRGTACGPLVTARGDPIHWVAVVRRGEQRLCAVDVRAVAAAVRESALLSVQHSDCPCHDPNRRQRGDRSADERRPLHLVL